MKFAYYPGCSLKGINTSYDESLRVLFRKLGIELVEIPDWNCCGATAYMSIDEPGALLMTSRNISLAARMNLDIIAPCSACYLNLLKVFYAIETQSDLGIRICRALDRVGLDFDYRRVPRIKHPLQVLVDDYGVQRLVAEMQVGLSGYRIAPYYGCLIVRPYPEFDHPLHPGKMDFLFQSLGAEVATEYPLKTKCCGGTLPGTIEEIGLRLNFVLLKEAKKNGCNMMATVCPLCQFNLEMYQSCMAHRWGERFDIPVLYFTQTVGIALGLNRKDLGMQRLLYAPQKTISPPGVI